MGLDPVFALVMHGAKSEVCFADTERVLNLRKVDVPAPQLARVLLLAVGAQQMRCSVERSSEEIEVAFQEIRLIFLSWFFIL